jgi:hypothetical protein
MSKRIWAGVFAVLAIAALAPGGTPAGAAATHHAAVVVDTGSDTHKVVITFNEDSITGIDALSRAGADPVVYSYAGQGGAVCRLYGVGRDAGPNCLGGQDGDNRYWAYFRAPAGSSSFTYSSEGAGTTRVHDGDVEGWRFGTGQAPQFVSLQSLLPSAPTAPPATAASATGGVSNPPVAPGRAAAVAPVNPGNAATATPSTTLPVTGATGAASAAGKGDGATTTRDGEKSTDAKSRRATDTALAASTHDGGGSSATSLIWFALLLVAIVAAVLLVRRVRRRPVP